MKVKRKITQVGYENFYYKVKINYDSYKKITHVDYETFYYKVEVKYDSYKKKNPN